ncbi:MAG: metal-dependent transcriptional regulator [Methanosarcinaceae archaeon]|nr:metal-dependent transcriptional regulator [Methanosarcinaceae archaeon]
MSVNFEKGSFSGLELTPRKIPYMKYLLSKNDLVRTNELSENLGVEPSTVTKTLDELVDEGYVYREPYRGVRLTDIGVKYASFLVHRHQILELVFGKYGISPKEICDEVSRIEPFVSKKSVDTICASMGHPTISQCPSGSYNRILCPENLK